MPEGVANPTQMQNPSSSATSACITMWAAFGRPQRGAAFGRPPLCTHCDGSRSCGGAGILHLCRICYTFRHASHSSNNAMPGKVLGFCVQTFLPSKNADLFVTNWTSLKKCGLFCAKLDFLQKMRILFVQSWTSLKKCGLVCAKLDSPQQNADFVVQNAPAKRTILPTRPPQLLHFAAIMHLHV